MIDNGNASQIKFPISKGKQLQAKITKISDHMSQESKKSKTCSPLTKAKLKQKIIKQKSAPTENLNRADTLQKIKVKNSKSQKRKGPLLDEKLVQVGRTAQVDS